MLACQSMLAWHVCSARHGMLAWCVCLAQHACSVCLLSATCLEAWHAWLLSAYLTRPACLASHVLRCHAICLEGVPCLAGCMCTKKLGWVAAWGHSPGGPMPVLPTSSLKSDWLPGSPHPSCHCPSHLIHLVTAHLTSSILSLPISPHPSCHCPSHLIHLVTAHLTSSIK